MMMSPPLIETSGRHPPAETTIDVTVALVAWAVGIQPAEILGDSRGEAEIAWARQLAIYLAHVALGHDLTRLSAVFGRDRATVRHALRTIEDHRDDPGFDTELSAIEAILLPLRPDAGRGVRS